MIDAFLIDEAKNIDTRELIEKDLGEPEDTSGKWNFYHCPFPDHREKSASFAVTRDGYKCFGACGRAGDNISWMTEYKGLTFQEAIYQLTGRETASPPDPLEQARLERQRAERVREQLEAQIEKAQKAIDELRRVEKWLTYYEQAGQVGKQAWHKRGVNEEFRNFWQLGYCPDYPLYKKHGDTWLDYWHSPTISIPIRGYDWQVNNVKHRLERVPENGGKYRYEQKDIPAQPFICFPEQKTGPLFLAEGEIKAMIVYQTADNVNLQVAGLPAMKPHDELFQVFQDHDPIYLCLDPDAYKKPSKDRHPPAWDVIKLLGKERVRFIRLPDKIDDLITKHDLKKSWITSLMHTARRAG